MINWLFSWIYYANIYWINAYIIDEFHKFIWKKTLNIFCICIQVTNFYKNNFPFYHLVFFSIYLLLFDYFKKPEIFNFLNNLINIFLQSQNECIVSDTKCVMTELYESNWCVTLILTHQVYHSVKNYQKLITLDTKSVIFTYHFDSYN